MDTFYVGVGFVLFIGLLVYLGVPKMIGAQLDARAARIRSELEEAARLREESQALYAEYQRKQKAALKEAEEIVEAARAEAKRLTAQAEADLKASLTRRQAQAEAKIAQAEAAALAQVRAAAIELATEAARRILHEGREGPQGQAVMTRAVGEVRSLLN